MSAEARPGGFLWGCAFLPVSGVRLAAGLICETEQTEPCQWKFLDVCSVSHFPKAIPVRAPLANAAAPICKGVSHGYWDR